MRTVKVIALVLTLVLVAVGCTILAATRPDQVTEAIKTVPTATPNSATPTATTTTPTGTPAQTAPAPSSVPVTAPVVVNNPQPKQPEPSAPTTAPTSTAPHESNKGVFKDGQEVWIEVNQGQQKVYVHQGDQIIKTFIASTGLPDQPTPNGTFYVQNRDTWFYSPEFEQGAKYWVSFLNWGEYLFHSVPMNEKQEIIPEEAQKLGQKASHGCVRLAVDDAKWIYDHIEASTRVVIHD